MITVACINFVPSQNTFYFNQIITSLKTKAKIVVLMNTFFAKKYLNTCINHLILPASYMEDIIVTPISQIRMLKQRAKYVHKASKWESQE